MNPSPSQRELVLHKVPLRNFLEHLVDSSGGLKVTDTAALLSDMLTWWADDPYMLEHINRIKEPQQSPHKWPFQSTTNGLLPLQLAPSLSSAAF